MEAKDKLHVIVNSLVRNGRMGFKLDIFFMTTFSRNNFKYYKRGLSGGVLVHSSVGLPFILGWLRP